MVGGSAGKSEVYFAEIFAPRLLKVKLACDVLVGVRNVLVGYFPVIVVGVTHLFISFVRNVILVVSCPLLN